ncbi:hypothetical protein UlMin_020925 [Ulmus minor]
MIKRRFYKIDHGNRDNDDASDSSSSSSDSEIESEPEATDDESEGDDGVSAPELQQDGEACSTSSGYESEDSSANEIDIDSSGQPINEEDDETGSERESLIHRQFSDKSSAKLQEKDSNIMEEKDLSLANFPACVLKCKLVFKCRICPRIVCLNEETLMAHLKSKRHARSEKLLNEGRLKAVLNSDGEIDNEVEDSPAKQTAQKPTPVKDKPKKGKRRQDRPQRGQNKRLKKKKTEHNSDVPRTAQSNENPAKKRRKHKK